MNILHMVQEQLSPQTLDQISSAVGETPEATKSAFGAALPALLVSLAGEAWSSKCATNLFNQVNQSQPQGGGPESASDLLSSFDSGADSQGPGRSLATSMLGARAKGVADFMVNRCGIKSASAMSILGMAASLLMRSLGRVVSSQGLGASGFGQLLRSQVPHLQGLIPPEMAQALGIVNLKSFPKESPSGVGSVRQGLRGRLAPASQRPSDFEAPPRNGILRWAWIPLVVLLGLFAGRWLQHRNAQPRAMGGSVEDMYNAAQTPLSTGFASLRSMELVPEGPADRLARTITSGEASRPLALEGTTFAYDGNLTGDARAKLEEVGKVLQAVPNVSVTLTAYGRTAEEGLARAGRIRSVLVSQGVAADRVAVRGEAGKGAPELRIMK